MNRTRFTSLSRIGVTHQKNKFTLVLWNIAMKNMCFRLDVVTDGQLIRFLLRLTEDDRSSIRAADRVDLYESIDHTGAILVRAAHGQMLEEEHVAPFS